jgi:hypothetical protein
MEERKEEGIKNKMKEEDKRSRRHTCGHEERDTRSLHTKNPRRGKFI